MKNRFYILIMSVLLGHIVLKAQAPVIFSKYFIKKGKVVFRLVPKDRKSFDELNNKSLKVIRYESVNGVFTNSVVIADLLRSYYKGDSTAWMKLIRKDKDKAGFVYNCLYPQKANEKLSLADNEKLNRMSYQMMLLSCDLDRDIAEACGVYVADTSVDNNKLYSYIFSIHTQSTSISTYSMSSTTLDASRLTENILITDLKGKGKGKVCTINWKAINYKADYSGYNVYRSTDSLNFQKVNKVPLVLVNSQFEKTKQFIYYNDSMPVHGQKYFYVIKGINFFGEEGPQSNVSVAYSELPIKSTPLIDTLRVAGNGSVLITWRMSDAGETSLPGKYLVFKSDRENGRYTKVFEDASRLKFIDSKVTATSFYKVAAVSKYSGDTIYSFSRMAVVVDTIPPAPVDDCRAIVDKSGKLTLSWQRNKETDLLGYKIFRANRLTDEFVQLNSQYIKDTFYIEKLNLKTLSRKIYFKLAADDKNRNSSTLSVAIEVTRPDTIVPSSPVISSVAQKKNGIVIQYHLSASEDVSKHILLRKDSLKGQFKEILVFHKSDSAMYFFDTLLTPARIYTYKLKAIDESNNISFSNSVEHLFETGFRKRVEEITYAVDRSRKEIFLNWRYDEPGIEKYIIYRGKKNEKLTIIKTLEGNQKSYIDNTVNMGNNYEYRLKAVAQNGAESIISAPVNIQY